MPPTIGRIASAKIGPWKGMNEKVSPDTLPPGVAADLQNVLLDETPGTVVKCQGSRAQAALPSGLPPRDTYTFTKLDGTSYLLISDGVTLYSTPDPSSASFYTVIITGLNPDGFLAFETAENKVWMTNGIDAFMVWDGATLVLLDRTRTVATASANVTTTTIENAELTEADDYWNGQELVFTSGANVGTVVVITDFSAATDTLTFTPAVVGITVNDDFIVGVDVPRGQSLRYWDGHLFDGCTADNQAELRFSEISDPDTGEVMTLMNPRAWPAANELALNILDQEKLWGITPILRDRVMVHKASGLWRLERDPLVRYRLELVSRSIGSRFPDTWAEKNNLLYFLGQDKDGFPEIYKTDMVDVKPVDPDGGVEPTLRDLQQPNAVQQSRAFTTTADFDAGTRSSLVDTAGSQLGVGAFDTQTKILAALVSGSNVDVETTPGKIALLGVPDWVARYEGDVYPQSASPVWTAADYGFIINTSLSGGALNLSTGTCGNPNTSGGRMFFRDGLLSSSVDTYLAALAGGKGAIFVINNGAKGIGYKCDSDGYLKRVTSSGYTNLGIDVNTPHYFNLLLKSDGSFKLWVDGTLVDSGTAANTTENRISFGLFDNTINGARSAASCGNSCSFGFLYYHTDFKGDSLSTQGGKISQLTLPDVLPSNGNIVLLNDMTRTPDSIKRLYHSSELYAGTAGLESWTSDTVGFTTGNDAAGYVVVANGDVPGSAIKRAQRVRETITRSDYGNAPITSALYCGMLWISPAIQNGSFISAWRTFLSTLTAAVGTDQTVKIRRATTSETPEDADYGAWVAIVNGNNIGTILGDATPPTSRWTQLKVEQGPSSAGVLPYIEAMVVQWTDGSAANLPVRGIVHKKRYMIVAASALVSANDIIIVCDRNDQWTKFRGLSLNALIHFKGNLYGLDAAAATTRLMDIDGLYNHDGVAIDAYLITREEDFGAGHLRKNFRFSYLEWDRTSAAWSLTTSYRRSGDADYTGAKTLDFGAKGLDIRHNFPVGIVGKRIQRKYQNAVLDESMALMGETCYFDIRPAQGA